ncbi:MAG: hypothetical protein ACI8P0_000018 [Planctomycetaceae bacterium]|jgi:hypothetical protein
MLTFETGRRFRDCNGTMRRDFLKVGALGTSSLTLGNLMRARTKAVETGASLPDTSVIWVWLGGGPTHVETFDPKMTAPMEYRSVTGEVSTNLPGVTLGGTFTKMAKVADKMAFVRSFAHTNSGHGGGTHFLMTGYDDRNVDNGGLPSRPSMGSIVSRVRGTNHPQTGMPTYVRLGGIGSDGAAFLGAANSPFDPAGQARKNMALTIKQNRLSNRRSLLSGLDNINRQVDSSGLMEGLDAFEQQAFSLVLSRSQRAFDLKYEDPRVSELYGPGLGQQMLRARRLVEAGAGFVTVSYGGWDMHGKIEESMRKTSVQLDHAVHALIEDLNQRSMDRNVLVVIAGEFGRTPKINKTAGRDHWAPLSTLALSGGGLRMGQVIGESASKVDVPKTTPIRPSDLMATVFQVLGVDPKIQFVNEAGRPVYMLEDGRPIRELV